MKREKGRSLRGGHLTDEAIPMHIAGVSNLINDAFCGGIASSRCNSGIRNDTFYLGIAALRSQ
jgi:hypothetical protein